MKSKLAIFLWGALVCSSLAQEKVYQVVAEPGDGIYSILRKQGLDPVENYQAFVTLNSKNIKDGSFLHVGKSYYIPFAADSFKNMGIRIVLPMGEEEPIFEGDFEKLSRKSNTLKNAIYYLITENRGNATNGFAKEVESNLTLMLLEHGAQVYVVDDKSLSYQDLSEAGDLERDLMGRYVEAINKKYLKHAGKYQRLLIIRSNGAIDRKMDISVYHHKNSEEGQRLSQNLREAFQKHSVRSQSVEDVEAVFQESNMLYLVKNVLPAVSLMDLDGTSRESKAKSIEVLTNKDALAKWLANGISKDYADLEIEEE